MSEITKGPWSYHSTEGRDYGERLYSLDHKGSPFVCVGTMIDREEDARHIVHCVNNYDRLVEALENLHRDSLSSFDYRGSPRCAEIDAILATLEAEKRGG